MAAFLDLPSNNLRNQLLHEILQCATCSLLGHDIHHPFTDLSNLSTLGIRRLLNLILTTLRKRNNKNTQKISVRRLDIGMGLNERLPFTDERFKFIRGEGHAREVCETVLALDFVDAEFDFSEGMFFVVLEVGEGNFENSAFEGVVGGF